MKTLETKIESHLPLASFFKDSLRLGETLTLMAGFVVASNLALKSEQAGAAITLLFLSLLLAGAVIHQCLLKTVLFNEAISKRLVSSQTVQRIMLGLATMIGAALGAGAVWIACQYAGTLLIPIAGSS